MAFYIIAQNQMQHDVYSSFSASLRLCASARKNLAMQITWKYYV